MKNRVLIIVENLPVPFDPRVWKEACSLRDNGYQVAVLCPRGKNYQKGYEFLEGIAIYRHPMPRERQRRAKLHFRVRVRAVLAVSIFLANLFSQRIRRDSGL